MAPFLQFRVWLRRGPTGERAAAGTAALLLLALVAWALVPVDDEQSVDVGGAATAGTPAGGTASEAGGATGPASSSGTDTAGATGAGGAAPAAPGSAAGGAPGAEGSAAATAPTGGGTEAAGTAPGAATEGAAATADCTGLTATDQGITESEIFVAVPILNLGGDVGNETFGIRSDLEEVAQAAASGINAEGGVACRKLRIKTYRVNPLNQNEQRAVCLQIAADKPFSVIDFGGYLDAASRSCFPANKLPYQAGTPITEREATESFPYMYAVYASADRQLRSWVFKADERGAFDPGGGFKKLGLLLNGCEPGINDELKRNLNQVGVKNDQMTVFTLSCTAVAPPNQIQQAALQHRQDGATHVFFAASQANASSYVQAADRVQWKPVYLASDYGLVTNSTSEGGWSDGFDGSVAITSSRSGELNSGMTHHLVAPCKAWYERAKVPPPEKDGDPAFAFCTFFRLFQAAGNAAGPNLVRTSLLDGLAKVGRFESTTDGDAIYDRPRKVTGGDAVRAIQWHLDCTCWKVLDADFTPAP